MSWKSQLAGTYYDFEAIADSVQTMPEFEAQAQQRRCFFENEITRAQTRLAKRLRLEVAERMAKEWLEEIVAHHHQGPKRGS